MDSTLVLNFEGDFTYHPLEPNSKRPILKDWTTRATRDAKKIAQWRGITNNFGVCADEDYCILESDDFPLLCAELGETPPTTYTVQARANRPHLYYKQSDATRALGNLECAGVFEFKQHNRYVVAEGSIHPTAKTPYLCINDAPIAPFPDHLIPKLRLLKERSPKSSDPQAGGRHGAIGEWCGKNWVVGISDEDFIQGAIDFDAANNDPPRGHKHAAEYAQWFIDNEKERVTVGPGIVLGARLTGSPTDEETTTGFDYVVGPSPLHDFDDDNFDGLFPLGAVSLIFGGSGAGKTTFGLQLLTKQSTGAEFFGRKTFSRRWIMVTKDRDSFSTRRTFRRMKIDMATVPLRDMPKTKTDSVARCIENLYLTEKDRPRAIFIEGLDLFVSRAKDADSWIPVLEELSDVARRYNLAIVASVGSPKTKIKEGYAAPRDRAFGSQALPRMVETMIEVQLDHDTGQRVVTIMPRNAPQEQFRTAMKNGVLVRAGIVTNIMPCATSTKAETIAEWLRDNPDATAEQVMATFSVSKRTAYRGKKRVPCH